MAGALIFINSTRDAYRRSAYDVARTSVSDITTLLEQQIAPMHSLAHFISIVSVTWCDGGVREATVQQDSQTLFSLAGGSASLLPITETVGSSV